MNSLLKWLLLVVLALVGAGAMAQEKVIRANDKVKVVCEEEPALNRDYTVTRDGFILLNFIGAVRVQGLSEAQAGDRIEEELLRQRILRKATVTVTLLTSESLPVRFSGAVRSPGELPWREGMRLSDVVSQCKPLETADLEKIRIESRLGEITNVNFKRFDGKDVRFNPTIRAGDFVFFPITTRETQIFVLGTVVKPGAIDFKREMTLAQALQAAGGVRPEANPDRVRFTREGQAERIVSLRTNDLEMLLQPGDRFVVEAVTRGQFVIVMGGVKAPGSIGFNDGLTLSRAIQIAGGLQDRIKPGKVRLTRRVGERTTVRDVRLDRILDGFTGDVTLQAGDRIDVPMPRRANREAELLPLGVLLFILFGR